MMRRELWQKQKRPSACLICRFNSTYRRCIRPALPSLPDSSSGTSLDYRSGTLLRNNGRSDRLYSAVAGSSGNGHRSAPDMKATSRFGTSPWTRQGHGLPRFYSIGSLPSWATQQPTSTTARDGLLPHEHEAKKRASGTSGTVTPPSGGNAQAANNADDGLLPHERAAKERASVQVRTVRSLRHTQPNSRSEPASAPKDRLQARAFYMPQSPSTGVPAAQRDMDRGRPPRRANTADALTPLFEQELTARRRLWGTESSSTRPQTLRESALPEFPLSSTRPQTPRESALPEFPLSSTRPQTPRESALPEFPLVKPRESALPEFPLVKPRESALPELPLIQRASPRSLKAPAARSPDSQDTNSAQGPAVAMEWSHLARRRQAVARKLDLSRPLDPGQLFGEQQQPSRVPLNPRSPLGRQQASAQRAQPNDDPWKELLQSQSDPDKKQKQSDPDVDIKTWAWVDEDASRFDGTTKDMPMQQKVSPAPRVSDSSAPDSRWRDKKSRRSRDDRDDRVRRSDKPKNTASRRSYEEDDDFDESYEERRRRKAERQRQKLAALEAAGPTPILLPEYISVANLATALRQKVDVFVAQLEDLGFEEVSKENILTGETAALIAQEYGFEPTVDTGEDEDLKPRPPPEDLSSLPLRPPVVTIMGHVDHGKTTLLDYLRKSSIVAQEHGGITQHIGAFSVKMSSGKQITFLDTPGHAAFLAMRQRGALVTDMVILVVAADDSVMPQTREAIKHARAAKVPIIVAINKIDKPEANVDRVKSDLASHGVEIEDYGGDVQVVCVSGKTGQGMDDLEESILTLSEMLDIRAETDGMAEGWVLESTIKPLGRVATVLVKRGTLRPGDFIVAGCAHAKIRSLRNEAGVEVREAPPGTAVEILGWKEPPEAGDMVLQAPDEDKAKAAVRYRQELKDRGEVIAQMAQQEQDRRELEREREEAAAAADSGKDGDPANTEPEQSGTKYVNFTVKGDVHGSTEAVAASILEQGNNEVRARVLRSSPGQINESDVEHAAVSGSTIVNFNNPIPPRIRALADDAGVKIMEHNIIYNVIEDVREQLAAALPPVIIQKVVGEAEVLQIFPINLKGRVYKNIAGCRVNNGLVLKGAKARVLRHGETVFEGVIETLRQVKKDVTEMKKGSECGLSFADWDELRQGDHIQVLEEIVEKRRL